MRQGLRPNPLSEYMANNVKDKEVYTVILNSSDTIQTFQTRYNQRSPPAVETPDPNDNEANVGSIDIDYVPNNDDLDELITDTRRAVFKVDWGAVLPHQYKKFHLETYFVSELCKEARTTLPNIATLNRGDADLNGLYNTSDGRKLSSLDGYFIKINIDGLSSSNIYDSKTGGLSNCFSLVKRSLVQYSGVTDFENYFLYETMSPHLCSPVVNYPASSIITVNIYNEELQPVYLEAFMSRDYNDLQNNTIPEIPPDPGAGDPGAPEIPSERFYSNTPQLANWSIVLSFRPIE